MIMLLALMQAHTSWLLHTYRFTNELNFCLCVCPRSSPPVSVAGSGTGDSPSPAVATPVVNDVVIVDDNITFNFNRSHQLQNDVGEYSIDFILHFSAV